MQRVANIRPRFYFANPSDAQTEPEPAEPVLLKELREALERAEVQHDERLSKIKYDGKNPEDSNGCHLRVKKIGGITRTTMPSMSRLPPHL